VGVGEEWVKQWREGEGMCKEDVGLSKIIPASAPTSATDNHLQLVELTPIKVKSPFFAVSFVIYFVVGYDALLALVNE